MAILEQEQAEAREEALHQEKLREEERKIRQDLEEARKVGMRYIIIIIWPCGLSILLLATLEVANVFRFPLLLESEWVAYCCTCRDHLGVQISSQVFSILKTNLAVKTLNWLLTVSTHKQLWLQNS